MGLHIVTQPAIEPVDLDEAKKRCELPLDDFSHDDHLSALITEARQRLERHTKRAFINQTWRLTRMVIDGQRVYLPRPPFVSLTTFQFRNASGSMETIASDSYRMISSEEPAFIWSDSWPSLDGKPDGLVATYVCGYGTLASDVPRVIREAILELVAFKFRYRGDFQARLPDHVRWSMNSLRCGVFGDYYGLKQ